MTPPFILKRDEILKLLSQDSFYKEVPEFFCLRKTGNEATTVNASAVCPSCEKNKKTQYALELFLHHLVTLHFFCGPESLFKLQRYIAKRLGYQPDKILVYHRVNQTNPTDVALLTLEPPIGHENPA